jgi:hypothetical protein
MSAITYHACDVCGARLDKGTQFYGVSLKREKVDQGFWSSDDTRWAEICPGCSLTVSVATLLETFFGAHPDAQAPGVERTEK